MVVEAVGARQSGSFAGSGPALAERLEKHELVYFPICPFPLPAEADLQFLCQQRLGGIGHKNISYNPHTRRVSGFAAHSAPNAERLRAVLAAFSGQVTAWLSQALPNYAQAWQLDRASFRPEEEATRHLRLTARNDLLHIDAFPTRPTQGRRILRCFININPTEPRSWVTSDPLPKLLQQWRTKPGFPGDSGLPWSERVRGGLNRWFSTGRPGRSAYDLFMLRLHDYLKRNDSFQEHCPKRYWTFAPGSAWLAFTDAVSHGELRGRYALEHSFFVPTHVLFMPHAAPLAYFQRLHERRGRKAA